MKVNDFIKELESITKKYRENEIILHAPNGLEFEPKVKIQLDKFCKPTGKMVITWE